MPAQQGPSRPALVFAWLGAILFVASLSFFLFAYAVTFGETASSDEGVRAIAIDVTLFTVFALHHSVFARERVRAWVARFVTPELERSFYVWVASVLFILVCALWQPVPGVAWHATGGLRWLLLGLQGAGIWLILRSAAILDIFELSGIRQLTPHPHAVEFKTSGPYGWIRHPIYAGWLLTVFSTPTMTMTRLVFASVSSLYLLMAIPLEERSLLRGSGGAYERYMQLVKWKLVPGLY